MGMNSQMDPKTKELVETAKSFVLGRIAHGPLETGALVDRLRVSVLEQDKRARHAEEEQKLFSKRIAELEAELAVLRVGDVVPTNENFVRVAMAEHCAPLVMDDRYIREWSRRFGPALDIIRARVSFKVNELEAKLAEAIDLAGEAIPYVSDYFRTKYELDARLAKLLPSTDKLTE
mgnify:FL=1